MHSPSGGDLLLDHLVSLLVPLQDVLQAAQQAHEGVPLDAGQGHLASRLDTGLALDVVQEGQLPEVVALLVLVDLHRFGSRVF